MNSYVRINLLPGKSQRKRDGVRQQLWLLLGVLFVVVVGNLAWNYALGKQQQRLETQVSDVRARIAQLQRVIGEVDNINKRKKEVEAKLKVLDELARRRNGPVRLLDALSLVTPERLSLLSMEEKDGVARISGTADSLDDVSEFMKSLSTVVWTPKGIGKIVEVKRDTTMNRVELLTGAGGIEDFKASETGNFFTGVELRATTSETTGARSLVKFELNLRFNYVS